MFVHIFTGTTLQGITPSTRPLVIGEGNTRVPLSDVMALIVGISKLMDNFGCWIELGILFIWLAIARNREDCHLVFEVWR